MTKLASALIAATALVLGAAPSSEAEGFRGHHEEIRPCAKDGETSGNGGCG